MSADNYIYIYVWRGRDSFYYVDMLFMSPESSVRVALYTDEEMWAREDRIKKSVPHGADYGPNRFSTATAAILHAHLWDDQEYIVEYGVSIHPDVLRSFDIEQRINQ